MRSAQTRSVLVIAVVAVVAATAAILIAAVATSTAGSEGISSIVQSMVSSSSNADKNNNNHQASAATMGPPGLAPVNRTFWIDTIHLDGTTNIHGDKKHPPEPFPANATYPKGAGFVLTPPDKSGTWNFRSFTFSTSQIVVYQGDRVTLNFVGVQGSSHYIEVEGIASFPLTRGEIHSVTFVADKVGTIDYRCHIHMPNMYGEILVLPRPGTTTTTTTASTS